MSDSIQNYQLTIKNNFNFLKTITNYRDAVNCAIKLSDDMGYLVPVCELHKNDEKMIHTLKDWRNKNQNAFPVETKVTDESTAKWLKEHLLSIEDRILFIVQNKFGHPVGHVGLANGFNEDYSIELDNIIRGEESDPGIMTTALTCLIHWCEELFSPKNIYLKVLSDNEHAIKFYNKIGLQEGDIIPISDSTKKYLKMNFICDEVEDNHFISTAGPSITAREVSYATDAARSGWNKNWNYYIHKFENTFSEYLNIKYALSTSSCTGALHIALAALGIGPGDEVIVPDITWVASANAVVYVGATPVFVDISQDSWTMDPSSLEKLISEKTKAIIPVHLYGHPAPMDKIMAIAKKYNLYVIEDAAPAIGAEWQQQKVGTFGDFATFSFQGAKLAVCGEGGILVTNNKNLYEKAYTIWDQGREPNTFWIKQNGLKYKMSNIQAAIALGQIERISELIAAKRRVFNWYHDHLSNVTNIKLNYETQDAFSIYWMTSILLDPNNKMNISRDNLREKLKKNNIDTRSVFPAISQYPHWPRKQNPQATALFVGQNAINLPSGVCLKEREVRFICNKLKEFIQ